MREQRLTKPNDFNGGGRLIEYLGVAADAHDAGQNRTRETKGLAAGKRVEQPLPNQTMQGRVLSRHRDKDIYIGQNHSIPSMMSCKAALSLRSTPGRSPPAPNAGN